MAVGVGKRWQHGAGEEVVAYGGWGRGGSMG